ncbi:class I SAM-dependent methyltransferase family protein [Halostagnicola sp. A-GB9-2]|uniref:class I SAM-dependent methyltransferase n=1 Tax=Halostagnicola sp. A-GB9-2 TaxID=3048066 RepID=UPI0024C0C872|nr:class I SAM-dependent methyltransferase family protein [Halostagnicola sp. A-GB9-2]MDJ1432925.1 class I SAM-dependent methyltransferase family protein [Halostagnicola sp. A-GB9-2]
MTEEPEGASPIPEGESPTLEARTDTPLAVVVEKPRAETATESLRAECVYDDERRVREYTAETVALPVSSQPSETSVLEVIRQIDPDYRSPDLETRLAERGWSDAELETVPGSWAVVGSVILVTVPEDCPDETALGEELLGIHGEAESVLADEGVANDGTAGTYREPRTRLLAGHRDTETIHVEHGTKYGLDPTEVMFSPGNQAERARMGEVVSAGERVFDMFAGIGYFTLPMARAGAKVTAAEVNPTAFRYLLENAMLNEVQSDLEAYMTDCRELAEGLEVDRVVMGYYGVGNEPKPSSDPGDETGTRTDEAHEFLPAALEALEPGGTVHYHEATPESLLWERPVERVEGAIETAGRTLERVDDRRRVKSHSAGVEHVVLDAVID